MGYCGAGLELELSSAFPHFGEERPLVGIHGSGTIFLTHCNLQCVFCQNYEISCYGEGMPCSYDRMASIMIELQEHGCHNINYVTPTHYVPQILKALSLAISRGLTIPLVYNCSGYESAEVIKILNGIFDIYMPDIKFLDPELSSKYCKAKDYPEVAREVIKEMHRQVGDFSVDNRGIAKRGLLIRHLLMPGCTEDTKNVLRFIKEDISPNAYVNVMAQYHPCHRAGEFSEISRRPSHKEYADAIEFAQSIGLKRAFTH